jgi:hypothetical protein
MCGPMYVASTDLSNNLGPKASFTLRLLPPASRTMPAPFAVIPVVRNNATSEVAVSRRKLQKLCYEISCLESEVELIEEQGESATAEELLMDVAWVLAHLKRCEKMGSKLMDQSRPLSRRHSV